MSVAARIAAAQGDAQALLTLAIELNAALTGSEATIEAMRAAESERKSKQAGRQRRRRHATDRDVTLHGVTERDVTAPPPPQVSPSFPTPHITPSFPPTPLTPEDIPDERRLLERAPEAAEQVAGFLGGMPFARRLGWVTVLHWVMDEGPKLSGAELKRTIGDFCANVDRDKWTPTHFRGYSRGARREPAIAVVSDTPQGTAGQVFATIRSLVTEIPNPGRGIIRAIPKAKVAELGDRALAAYEQIGGAERFLDQTEKVGFLLRDFTNAYNSTTQPQRVSA